MDFIRFFDHQQVGAIERPRLRPGDVVRVEMQVKEGDKTRLQAFEGTVLGIRGSGPSTTLTVRRETGGFGVERIFPLYSPLIENIEIVKRQKIRRAKLTYLRQAGRRRFKEDVDAMQRHVRLEAKKRREAEAAAAAEAKAAKEEQRLASAAAKAKADEDEKKEASTEPVQPEAAADQPAADATDKEKSE